MHPDYLTAKGTRSAQLSVTKRVTGAVLGFAADSAKVALVANPAAERGMALVNVVPGDSPTGRQASPVSIGWGRFFTWWA